MKISAIDQLRQIISALSYEEEWILQKLPSIAAVIEYYLLWEIYDTEFLSGIHETISEGHSDHSLNDFCNRYGLTEFRMRKWLKNR